LKSSKLIYISAFLILNFNLYSQKVNDGVDYFFPIMPNEINYLSGTMGEIRSTHFHAGMDVKTYGRSGLPVYATLDGHVSRISVSPGGYGHALYILHPNGETSVYGHLLRFREDISQYVLEKQYEKKTFRITLFPDKDLFEIKKGELIGLSGNTGSSLGPHLHFEIRDKNQRPLNPLTKGYSEIKDQAPPTVYAFALQSMDIRSRINDEFGRFEFKVKKRGDEYYVDAPVEIYGKIGIQLKAYDKFNGTSNRNGIPYITVFLDEKKIFEVQIESFSFSDTRHVVNFYDYGARKDNNGIFQKMYIDDGNNLPFYPFILNKGLIEITDGQLHEIKIQMNDIYGNMSFLTIPVQGVTPSTEVSNLKWHNTDQISTELLEKYLKITAPVSGETANHCLLYSNRMRYELIPSYQSEELAVYLWDMNLGIPDSINVCDISRNLNYEVMLPSGVDFNFYNKVFNVNSFRKTLYDTVFLEAEYQFLPDSQTEIYTIGNSRIPLANPIRITLKPIIDYTHSDKYAVYSTTDFKEYSFVGNDWSNNEISFAVKSLGYFTILEDTLPPAIKPLQINRKKVSFRIDDELSGIKEFNAYLNDEWLLMHYDPKQKYIWSETLKPNHPLTGAFKLTVVDNTGNVNEYITQIE
jgi:hypothetical protein